MSSFFGSSPSLRSRAKKSANSYVKHFDTYRAKQLQNVIDATKHHIEKLILDSATLFGKYQCRFDLQYFIRGEIELINFTDVNATGIPVMAPPNASEMDDVVNAINNFLTKEKITYSLDNWRYVMSWSDSTQD